jgi:hypothetical protein
MTDEPIRHSPSLFRNWVSLAGATIVLVAAVVIASLFAIDMAGESSSPYLGILTFILFPAVLLVGLAVILGGALWERRRRRRAEPGEVLEYPVLDLNDPRRRRALVTFLVLALFFMTVSAVGSYHAYEYTESVAFCGQVCHTVMKPQFVAYGASPHARVRCVECHVGSGAGSYVRSKLSGVYQLYSVTFDKYQHPIPTPVESMRPARDTCEQCHWPEKFYGSQLRVYTHYGYDEANTPDTTRMLVHVGGGSPATGPVTGIHWHMNLANEITYFATDEHRQEIPWVQLKRPDGTIVEYVDPAARPTPDEIARAPKRTMDCIDCHNRPSHNYIPPDRAVDDALAARRIDATLPFLKREAVAALARPYTTTEEGIAAIEASLRDFYASKYPDVYAGKRREVDVAIAEVRRIFETYVFPEMGVTWAAHPNNVGHFYFEGCFRCHDGRHVSEAGAVIRNDCAICHTVLDQTAKGATIAPPDGAFRHPVALGDLSRLDCAVCHRGDRAFQHPVDLGDIGEFACAECHTAKGTAAPGA